MCATLSCTGLTKKIRAEIHGNYEKRRLWATDLGALSRFDPPFSHLVAKARDAVAAADVSCYHIQRTAHDIP